MPLASYLEFNTVDLIRGSANPGLGNAMLTNRSKFQDGVIVSFTELTTAWKMCVDGEINSVFKIEGNRRKMAEFVKRWNRGDSFIGAATDEMREWISIGYRMPGLALGTVPLNPTIPRRRIKYSEEGEFQFDLMRSGFDYPFLEWEKRPSKPGIKLEIGYGSSGGVSARVIADYVRWVGSAISTIEASGVDCAISIIARHSGIWRNGPATQNEIIVKRENEALDPNSWSPLFSPGGHRMLLFTLLFLSAENAGVTISSDIGRAIAPGYDCDFNPEKRVIETTSSKSSDYFPADAMTTKLMAALEKSKH